MKTVQITHLKSNYFWFEVFHPMHEEVIRSGADEQHLSASYTYNFDYEVLPAHRKRIFIDIGLKFLPLAEILVRSEFELKYSGPLEDLFIPEMLNPMIKHSLDKCILGFKDLCEENSLKFNLEIPVNEELIEGFSENMMNLYFSYRREEDIMNAVMINTPGIKFTKGTMTLRLVQVTFMVIDALLFDQAMFDRKHNRKHFGEMMPEVLYFSLKLKCIELQEHFVQLSLRQTVYFLECLDFTLQMLMGDQEELLMKLLAPRGLTRQIRDKFITEGSEFLEYVEKSLHDSKAHLTDLEKKYDWNRLIR